MKRISLLFFSIFLLLAINARSGVQGSDSSVGTALAFFTFPQNQNSTNRLANYGWAPNGFALQNAATTAVFDSVFPVSGNIQLNGGTLSLNRDLDFQNTTTL